MSLSFFARLVLAISFAPLAGAALAGAPDDDWARFGRDVDPNTFAVGHPASPRWVVQHANHEHPAVVAARAAREGHAVVDPNTYIVQPPASVTWLAHGDAPQTVTVAGRSGGDAPASAQVR
jgi:hypothetical protein